MVIDAFIYSFYCLYYFIWEEDVVEKERSLLFFFKKLF